MGDLIPIGRFSRLTGLTIKALRLYDERGLLRPALVDFRSGFRYYGPDQIPTAERIRELRSIEMPLDEIRALLDAGEPEVTRARLADHGRWIEGRIAGYRRALVLLSDLDEWYKLRTEGREMEEERQSRPYACSFCGKGNAGVERMIAGPNGVFICSECVDRCNEIIAEQRATA